MKPVVNNRWLIQFLIPLVRNLHCDLKSEPGFRFGLRSMIRNESRIKIF